MPEFSLSDYNELNFFKFSNQSNIYGLKSFKRKKNEFHSLLTFTIAHHQTPSELYHVEFNRDHDGELLHRMNEITFQKIPEKADVVCLDVFSMNSAGQVAIGIVYATGGESNSKYFMNIYADFDGDEDDINLNDLATCVQHFDLEFSPLALFHTSFTVNQKRRHFFLLSADDSPFHLYADGQHRFVEEPLEDYFPELVTLAGVPSTFCVEMTQAETRRLCCVGCHNGFIQLTQFELESKTILQKYTIQYDAIISRVDLFCLDALLDPLVIGSSDGDADPRRRMLHLLVASPLEVSTIYEDVLNKGFASPIYLPESDKHDVVSCGLVCDINMDGTNEIILGTYGQMLLCYKLELNPANTEEQVEEPIDAEEYSFRRMLRAKLISTQRVAYPVYSLINLDLFGDGMDELVLLSLKGIHVYQYRMDFLAELLKKRIKSKLEALNAK